MSEPTNYPYFYDLYRRLDRYHLSTGLSGEFGYYPTIQKSRKTKCYSARTALKRGGVGHLQNMAREYKGCLHCAWYSYVFYKHEWEDTKIIANNEDFEKVKKQFVNHMNRSHKDICKKKMMKFIENKAKYR